VFEYEGSAVLPLLTILVFFAVAFVLAQIFRGKEKSFQISVYVTMAFFWLFAGVLIQIFWTDLQPRMMIPIERGLMGIFCFIMFTYCFIRWRVDRSQSRIHEMNDDPPPRPRREYDPTFDFSDGKPDAGDDKKPTA
jgi:hypothetical protein